MSPLSDDYIRSLEPETLRYDVTIFDDFVISVLPNGIKTWAFIYDYEGRRRRKTLGVYPDMSYEQAEDALDNVRGMIAKLGDDIKDSPVEDNTPTLTLPEEVVDPPIVATPPPAEPPAEPAPRPAVLASRRRYRQHRSSTRKRPKTWFRPFALGLALVVGLGALAFIVPKLDLFGGSSDVKVKRATPGDRAVAQPIVMDDPAPDNDATDTPPNTDATPQATAPSQLRPVATAPPEPSAALIIAAPPPALELEPEPEPEPELEPEPLQPVAAQIQTPAPPEPTVAAPEPRPTPSAVVDAPFETPAELTTTTADAATDERPAAEVFVAQVSVPVPTTPPAQETQSQTTDPPEGATSTGGQVSRAVVSSNVRDLEPVDDLGQNVELTNGGYQTVFYFTELRNFTAGNIVHRWTVNGKVIADVPLRVGGGWRWRTYSSKDLLPGMTGEWSVAVIDGNGNVLGERRFRFDR